MNSKVRENVPSTDSAKPSSYINSKPARSLVQSTACSPAMRFSSLSTFFLRFGAAARSACFFATATLQPHAGQKGAPSSMNAPHFGQRSASSGSSFGASGFGMTAPQAGQ